MSEPSGLFAVAAVYRNTDGGLVLAVSAVVARNADEASGAWMRTLRAEDPSTIGAQISVHCISRGTLAAGLSQGVEQPLQAETSEAAMRPAMPRDEKPPPAAGSEG
jgi:hypothetical protein